MAGEGLAGDLPVPRYANVFGIAFAPLHAILTQRTSPNGAVIASAPPAHRSGRVWLKIGAMFGVLAIVGSYAGSLASAAVPANVLLAGFGLLMLTVAAVMILRRRGHNSQSGRASVSTGARYTFMAAATGVELITGFFGVSGGFAEGQMLNRLRRSTRRWRAQAGTRGPSPASCSKMPLTSVAVH